jgi:hypothetical protein
MSEMMRRAPGGGGAVRHACVLATMITACGDAREEPTTMSSSTLTTTTLTSSDTTGPDDDESSTVPEPWFDLPVTDLPAEECAGETVPAEQKLQGARVVFVVDNSASMYAETAEVQDRLNGFAQSVVDNGIDMRVAVLSAAATGYYTTNYVDQGICIDAPLGSGMCSPAPDPNAEALDTNLPQFLHVDQYTNSSNAIPVIIEQQVQWGPFTAGVDTVHFVVVSDDDSNQPASYFIENFIEVEPNRAAIFHAVVPTTDCPEAAQIGQVYIDLAELTGGVVGDLCGQDFTTVFQALTNAVVQEAELPCEYSIPVPPDGQVFDPEQVNVEFDDGTGGGFDVGYVESEADCASVDQGWYYDDPADPMAILVCPQTCQAIQGQLGSGVRVVLGCATIPAG